MRRFQSAGLNGCRVANQKFKRCLCFGPSSKHGTLRKTIKFEYVPHRVWIMFLEEYSYKIEIRKGVLHGNADGMSRGCHGKECICDELLAYERKYMK